MAKKVSKNQRTSRRSDSGSRSMAKVVIASKKANGSFEFRQKMVDTSKVQEELAAARA